MHATEPSGYRFSNAQSKNSPVSASIRFRSLAIVGVKGVGDITLPLYASPPMPSSAIQHVSRLSSTRFPSRVTSFSALNGTSFANASTVKAPGSSSTDSTFSSSLPVELDSMLGTRFGRILNGRPSTALAMVSPARTVGTSHTGELVRVNRPRRSQAHRAAVASCDDTPDGSDATLRINSATCRRSIGPNGGSIGSGASEPSARRASSASAASLVRSSADSEVSPPRDPPERPRGSAHAPLPMDSLPLPRDGLLFRQDDERRGVEDVAP